jgi:hypothetical protein
MFISVEIRKYKTSTFVFLFENSWLLCAGEDAEKRKLLQCIGGNVTCIAIMENRMEMY